MKKEIKNQPNSSISSKRNTLKTLVAGGALAGMIPETWRRPMVNAIVLPSHAQTTVPPPKEPPGCGDGGSCTSGMNVNIISAELLPDGDLFVLGDGHIPADCVTVTGVFPRFVCALLDSDGLIQSETFTSAGGDCFDDTATVSGCLVSCSILIASASHSVEGGDCITLRFRFTGDCVCSAVTTVDS
jgi:hypothetical protein